MNRNAASYECSGNRASFKRIVSWLMVLFAFVVVGIYLSRPLYDPDFYWHLKTGQWIWQNKALPHMDLFGVPPLPPPSPRTEFIFTSYWLLQLILYAFYSLSGMSGIILYRWIIAGCFLLVCIRWTNVRRNSVRAVMVLGTILLLEYYFIERPQFISFICFGILLVILFRFIERREAKSLWSTLVPLSLLMTLWSNMHGGFLIGQSILIFFVVAEGLKFFHGSLAPMPLREYQTLVISSVTALGASFINPNAVNLIKYLPIIFDSSYYVNTNNLEELSLFAYFRETTDSFVFFYGVSIALTFAALMLSEHRKNITWAGILAGTAFMGCQHMRLMPFFLVSATLFLTRFFAIGCPAIKGRLILYSMLAVTTVYCVRDEFPRILEATRSGLVPVQQFPVKAADFITSNNISGNIYTTMIWGGYLIWRTGPENKIFYDGRTLSVQRAREYDLSRIIVVGRRQYWKKLFDEYDIRAAVLPIYEDDGAPNLLAQSIYSDKEWTLVYSDERDVVFIRQAYAEQPSSVSHLDGAVSIP